MPETINTDCPTCGKSFKVPEQYAGKTIRCKECQNTFKVPTATAPKRAKPASAKPAKPVKPVKPARMVEDDDAPIRFKEDEPPPTPPTRPYDDDDDEDENPYDVITAGEDIPRCPFCAIELDPPDTKVCLNCGYDMLQRRRRETLAVYNISAGDYFIHWLPGIVCVLITIGVITFDVFAFLNMREWLTGSFLALEEKDELTQKEKFYLPPYCFNLWIGIISFWIIFLCTRFAIRRLILNWKPIEIRKAIEKE